MVLDGFLIPVNMEERKRMNFQGEFLMKTKIGSFREFYMVLHNNELYVYTDKENRNHSSHYVLSGGFVKIHRVHILNNLCLGDPKVKNILYEKDIGSRVANDRAQDIKKMFPIELSLGGKNGTLNFFFETMEIQTRCFRQL